ncbi:hypothetical protein DFR67_116107 [Williamsia limnetica]|uniref:Uncharacterized protein n=1 Tax=Williamsia limnetica TaxID=882452 RepID=A0A318RC14_WILLI|nr:hypothetical protein [Williamsia limnetica]PYE13553.1 hypothetical protein DFR67_116107 [Williamsia limnetica]
MTDTNGDGWADVEEYDTNFDGIVDTVMTDVDYDGWSDVTDYDTNYDGYFDTVAA